MGQNVNYLLGNQSQMLGADPELYRQQLIQQEQQRIAAQPQQNQLGATVGGLLGRGIGNLASGNNFFEVTNPVLKKLTQIQDIYSTSMKESDPNDPMSFYTSLQKNFADAGLGQQAMMAQVEAKKFEGVNIKSKKDLTELYAANPGELDSAIQRANQTGDSAAVTNLTTLKDTIEKKRNLDNQKEMAQIGLIGAQTTQAKSAAAANAAQVAAGKLNVQSIPDGQGGATIVYYDPIARKEVDRITVTSEVVSEFLKKKGGNTPGETKPGERRPLGEVLNPESTTTQATPRKVGPSEQIELDRLAARKADQTKATASYNQNLAQGRQDVNSLVALAAQQGYQPMGMQGSEILFIDPRTGAQKTSSQF
jgi:hypothetical protein